MNERERHRVRLTATAIALLEAQGWTFTRLPGPGISAKFKYTVGQTGGVASLRSSTERQVSGMYLNRKQKWQTYPDVDRVIVPTFRVADDPDSGVEVFDFPDPAEIVALLEPKRAPAGKMTKGPRFISIDSSGLALRYPAIACGPLLDADAPRPDAPPAEWTVAVLADVMSIAKRHNAIVEADPDQRSVTIRAR